MSTDSRANMIRSAASLIATRGVSATSFSDVLADSGAPRGSIYHHFPDGKKQLAQDAIRWTSGRVLAFQAGFTPTEPGEVLDRFIGMWRNTVVSSQATSGCVVAGTALDTDAGTQDSLIDVVRETFGAWIDLIAAQLESTGLTSERARSVATTTLAAMEGSLILCRAVGGVEPLELAAAELKRLV